MMTFYESVSDGVVMNLAPSGGSANKWACERWAADRLPLFGWNAFIGGRLNLVNIINRVRKVES
jgi:hypothetical protein